MPTNFSHLKNYDPKGRKSWYTIPIAGSPRLHMLHAGDSNAAYINGLANINSSKGATRRAQASSGDASAAMDSSVDVDRDLFARFVITDWDGVKDHTGELVPFSGEVCREFLDALPSWIIRGMSSFASIARNFLPDDAPDALAVEEQAGE